MNALFEIGQKVVCVDSSSNDKGMPSGLVEGKQYLVNDIIQCVCGRVKICVGIMENFPKGHCPCGAYHKATIERVFIQTRFIPLDFDRQADEAIHEALKGQKTLTN